MNTVKKETVIRTVVLIVALVNQFLTWKGLNPIPFTDEEIGAILSDAFAYAAILWAWWKNNSFTQPAIAADNFLKALRENNGDN